MKQMSLANWMSQSPKKSKKEDQPDDGNRSRKSAALFMLEKGHKIASCPRCTFRNPQNATRCRMCAAKLLIRRQDDTDSSFESGEIHQQQLDVKDEADGFFEVRNDETKDQKEGQQNQDSKQEPNLHISLGFDYRTISGSGELGYEHVPLSARNTTTTFANDGTPFSVDIMVLDVFGNENGRMNIIGLTDQGTPIHVVVSNFKRYFYLRTSEKFDVLDFQKRMNDIVSAKVAGRKRKHSFQNKEIIRVISVKDHRPLVFYRGDEDIHFVKVVVLFSRLYRDVVEVAREMQERDEGLLPDHWHKAYVGCGDPRWCRPVSDGKHYVYPVYQTYESVVTHIDRFMADNNISGGKWIRVFSCEIGRGGERSSCSNTSRKSHNMAMSREKHSSNHSQQQEKVAPKIAKNKAFEKHHHHHHHHHHYRLPRQIHVEWPKVYGDDSDGYGSSTCNQQLPIHVLEEKLDFVPIKVLSISVSKDQRSGSVSSVAFAFDTIDVEAVDNNASINKKQHQSTAAAASADTIGPSSSSSSSSSSLSSLLLSSSSPSPSSYSSTMLSSSSTQETVVITTIPLLLTNSHKSFNNVKSAAGDAYDQASYNEEKPTTTTTTTTTTTATTTTENDHDSKREESKDAAEKRKKKKKKKKKKKEKKNRELMMMMIEENPRKIRRERMAKTGEISSQQSLQTRRRTRRRRRGICYRRRRR